MRTFLRLLREVGIIGGVWVDGFSGFLPFPRGIFCGGDSRLLSFIFYDFPLLPFLGLGFRFRRGPSVTIGIYGVVFHRFPFSWLFWFIGRANTSCGTDGRGERRVGNLCRRLVFLPFFLLFADLGCNRDSPSNVGDFLFLPFFLLLVVARQRFPILSIAFPFLLFLLPLWVGRSGFGFQRCFWVRSFLLFPAPFYDLRLGLRMA